jgi:hypothetical protein
VGGGEKVDFLHVELRPYASLLPSAFNPLIKYIMLYTIAAILVILWLLGTVTSYTLGGFIHLLLVIAVITVLVRLIRGENPIK